MRPCASMMPVDGERKPATQRTFGLHLRELVAAQHPQIVAAVHLGLLAVFPEARELGFVARDDDFADAAVVDVVLGAIPVERLAACDAQARLQRAGGIVDPRVDDFGVARARVRAEVLLGLEQDDFAPAHRELAGDGKADDAGADHRAIDLFCHESIIEKR